MKYPMALSKFNVCFLTLLFMLLCACAKSSGLQAYHGKERAKDQIVVLECDQSITIFTMSQQFYKPWIWSVDGFRKLSSGGVTMCFLWAELLPGKHTVEGVMGRHPPGLYYVASKRLMLLGSEHKWITFTAKAGHNYILKGDVDEPEFWLWIEDASTGEQVGGTKPPE